MSPDVPGGTATTAGVLVEPAAPRWSAGLRRGWRRALRRPPAVAGAAVVLLFSAVAIGAPWIAISDPVKTDWRQIRKPPTWAHPFGTDDLGRDSFSRVVWGTRISMQAGVFAILLAIAIGVPIGLVAGYYRGAVDQVIMRLTDAWLSFPFLILAIGLVTILGPSLTNATVAIGLGATPTYIRLTRGLVLSTNEEDFVQGARALGAGDLRLMGRHILPNIFSALDAELGDHAELGAAVPRDGALDGLVAGARHLLPRPLVQPGGRRAARPPRSQGLLRALTATEPAA